MATLEILGKTLALDMDGHFANPKDWSEAIAREIWQAEGIEIRMEEDRSAS